MGGSLAFVAVGLTLRDSSKPDGWNLELATIFFGLCAAVFGWLFVSPGRVLLGPEGFTVKGGFELTPWTVRWRDVDGFVALDYRSGGYGARFGMVGLRYSPGGRPRPERRRFTRWRGADEVLPIWGRSPERVIGQLRDYQTQALARAPSDQGFAPVVTLRQATPKI